MKHILFYFLFLLLVDLFYYASNTTASPIINGLPDNHHLFKFHVSIHKKIGPGNDYQCDCGGSIISERYILTAAHCFMSIKNGIRKIFYPRGTTKIIAGTNHKNGPGIERELIRVFIPSTANAAGYLIDLAVAELSADLGVYHHPDRLAIMPLEELDPRSNAGVNQRASFCGFGMDVLVPQHDGQLVAASSGSTINRFLKVKILDKDECPMFDQLICVRNSETAVFRAACYGDSGSGLVYNNKIVGVLSSGFPTCKTLRPIEFTRLYGHLKFIEEAQNPRGDHRNMFVFDENPNRLRYSSAGGRRRD